MSKNSRANRKSARVENRAKEKAKKRLMYEQYGHDGRLKGSGRANQKSKRKTVNTAFHQNINCGNPAYQKCSKLTFVGFLNKLGIPVGMPQWMYLRWSELHG